MGQDPSRKGHRASSTEIVKLYDVTARLPPHSQPQLRVTPPNVSQRFILRNISWETYEGLLADLAEEHVFLTYDEGTLRTDVALAEARA